MIRSILAAFLFSFVLGSSALAQSCSVPNNLTNGTNADAAQVMANLNAILACVNNQAAPRGYLSGLTLSTAGSSASFGIAAGIATSDDATTSMKLATSSTKTTGAWAVGSGNGALDIGSIATTPTWYHVFLIERPDTGVVDVLISQNPTSPTMPASYTKKRRIGSMKTDGQTPVHWVAFTQNGDEFLWAVPTQDTTGTFTTTATLQPVNVPSGVQVNALFSGLAENAAANYVLFTSPDQTDSPASLNLFSVILNAGVNMPYSANVRTNTSAQIRIRASAATTYVYLNTFGWIDTRGRLQ